MARIIMAQELALGAVLAASHVSTAAEPDKALTGFTMTLGGKGTASEAATATDDTELTGGYHGGGYHGGGYHGGGYHGGGYHGGGSHGGGYHGGYGGNHGGYGGYRDGYCGGYRGYYGGYGGYGGYRARAMAGAATIVRTLLLAVYWLGYGLGYGLGYRGCAMASHNSYGYGGYGYGDPCYYGVNGTADDASGPVDVAGDDRSEEPDRGRERNSTPLQRRTGEPGAAGEARRRTAYAGRVSRPAGVVQKENASPYRYKAYGRNDS